MNNLYPEIYDFSFLKKIDSHKRIVLIVDDSHGIGINNNGLSAMSIIPQGDHVEILLVASMAKALGVDAGIVLGSEKNISRLKKSNEFLGASPPAAAGLYAFMQSDDIYAAALLKLKKNIKVLSKALKNDDNWHFLSDFPVFFSKNTDISENLLKQQILISSFRYPDIDGAIVNRIVLCAWHSIANIKKLITSL
jgi:7-keto-8-aminopelargonate synthetase-like enzyme